MEKTETTNLKKSSRTVLEKTRIEVHLDEAQVEELLQQESRVSSS